MTAAALVLEERPVVIRDVFPVEVTTSEDGQPHVVRSARVILTRERVYVFVNDGGRPTLVSSEAYTLETSRVPATYAPRDEPSHLDLLNGGTAHVNRQRGCGCGNPLKVAPLSVLLPGATRGVR